MIAVKIPCQLFHYFVVLVYWESCWIGSLRNTYITNTLLSVHLFVNIHIYYILHYVHVGGGAYKYLFSSRETESQCAECAVRCVYMC
jgi:hypothetical protein